MRYAIPISLVLLFISRDAVATPPNGAMITEVEQSIFERTNGFRKKNELPSVTQNENLNACASDFAAFMAENDKYGHHADGRAPAQRAQAASYDYCVIRENIAYRTNTGEVTADSLVQVFVDGWIDSPPHRENMLADFVTETGIGVATTDGVTYYAVQLFGRPKSAAIKLTIRNESSETRSLMIEANDSSDEVEMQPRMVLKMTRCFPTTLRLDGLDDSEVKLTESADLVISQEGFERK